MDDWEDYTLTVHEGGHTKNYSFAICGTCKALTLREDAGSHALWHDAEETEERES
jgi:hypothetical protein